MKRILPSLLLGFVCVVSLRAASDELTVAPHELNFQAAGSGEILSLLSPASHTVEQTRWNVIEIRLPEAVKYRPGLVLRGVARVASDVPANHIGFSIIGNRQKSGYAKARFTDGVAEFRIPFSEIIPDSTAANKEPLTPDDDIVALRIFASFREPENSVFTLESLSLALEE
jgi:hypothetical protein